MYARKWIVGMSVALAGMVGGCANYPQSPAGNAEGLQMQADIASTQELPANDSVLSMLVNGKLGNSNGTLVAAAWPKIQEHQSGEAIDAAKKAQVDPAKPADVRNSSTADLNGDGFVTSDEIVAMQKAALSQRQIISRLQQTFYHFELTPPQREYLRGEGVAPEVLAAIDPVGVGAGARTASLELGPAK